MAQDYRIISADSHLQIAAERWTPRIPAKYRDVAPRTVRMPDGTEERVANASRMVEAALAKGIPLSDIYIDPLVFPISVDKVFGLHCLDAIRELRGKFGPDVHITGGMSNVSFGVPARKR